MGKFYFAFAWDKIANLHMGKLTPGSDQIQILFLQIHTCKYTPVCICVRMHHLLTPSKICTPEYIYLLKLIGLSACIRVCALKSWI